MAYQSVTLTEKAEGAVAKIFAPVSETKPLLDERDSGTPVVVAVGLKISAL
jgi:hypothetical protein